MTTSLDIDSLRPERFDRAIEDMDRARSWRRDRFGYYVNAGARWGNGELRHPGFNPTKLYDWRRLEQRAHELKQRYDEASSTFWETLKRLHVMAVELDLKEVWIERANSRNPEELMVFNGKSLGHQPFKRLVDDCAGDPNKRAFIVRGKQGDAVHRLQRRVDSCRGRYGAYHRAFVLAVEARLQPFIANELMTNVEYRLYDEAVFIINNDDRQYTIYAGHHGELKWHGSKVYDCR